MAFRPAVALSDRVDRYCQATSRVCTDKMCVSAGDPWFLDPLAGRGYPRDASEGYGRDVPEVGPRDMEAIAAPIDFLGANYDLRPVEHDPAGGDSSRVMNVRSQTRQTGRGCEIQPQGRHLSVLLRAIHAGVPVRAYFCWTLADNFEWARGTNSRFGLACTDFAPRERTLKDSGAWYGRVARANALVDEAAGTPQERGTE